MKIYCDCVQGAHEWNFAGLYQAGPTKDGGIQYVVAGCLRPTQLVWQSWFRPCEDCLSEFSSPWETLCKPCWAASVGPSEGRSAWRGWGWARKQRLSDSTTAPETVALSNTEDRNSRVKS